MAVLKKYDLTGQEIGQVLAIDDDANDNICQWAND